MQTVASERKRRRLWPLCPELHAPTLLASSTRAARPLALPAVLELPLERNALPEALVEYSERDELACSVVNVTTEQLAREMAEKLAGEVGGRWTIHKAMFECGAAYEVRGPLDVCPERLTAAETAVRVAHGEAARGPPRMVCCAVICVGVEDNVLRQVNMPRAVALSLVRAVTGIRKETAFMKRIGAWTDEYHRKYQLSRAPMSTTAATLLLRGHTQLARPAELVALHLVEFWLDRAVLLKASASCAELRRLVCQHRVQIQGPGTADNTQALRQATRAPEHTVGRLAGVPGVAQQLCEYLLHAPERPGRGRLLKRMHIWARYHMKYDELHHCDLNPAWLRNTLHALCQRPDALSEQPLPASTGFVMSNGKLAIRASRGPSPCLALRPAKGQRAKDVAVVVNDMHQFQENRHAEAKLQFR